MEQTSLSTDQTLPGNVAAAERLYRTLGEVRRQVVTKLFLQRYIVIRWGRALDRNVTDGWQGLNRHWRRIDPA
jgi:hypothetical protein